MQTGQVQEPRAARLACASHLPGSRAGKCSPFPVEGRASTGDSPNSWFALSGSCASPAPGGSNRLGAPILERRTSELAPRFFKPIHGLARGLQLLGRARCLGAGLFFELQQNRQGGGFWSRFQ
jgi:hypothetical protein